MHSLWLALYLTCLYFKGTGQTTDYKPSIHVPQQSRLISANAGHNVTLKCFYEADVAVLFYWYKHTLGKRIKRISLFYRHTKSGNLLNEFENNPRFMLDTQNGAHHLIISDLKISDSAIYYCAGSMGDDLEFSEGIRVNVKSSGVNVPLLDHRSETIQPGGSKTLNCTLYNGTSDGEHNVYWFKTSDEDHPGIIYTHGDSNDQSEEPQTCVYNLPITSLDSSHAGTYYCAVASCGHIVVGDTDMEGGVDYLMLVYLLSGALAFTTILVVVLAYKTYSTNKSNSDPDCQRRPSDSVSNTRGLQDSDVLHYATVGMNKAKRSARQRDETLNQCVYSSVKQSN